MPSFDYDLRYFQAGLEQLENYLLSNDLYWPTGVRAPADSPPYPQLTPAGLLLALARMHARAAAPEQAAALDQAERRLDEVRTRWRTAWGKKAAVDFRARLNLWRDFLEEYRTGPESQYDRYPYEVGRRVQLQLLLPEALNPPAAELQMLDGLDGLLQSVFISDGFVWEPDLAVVFPSSIYWYLYGRVRKTLG